MGGGYKINESTFWSVVVLKTRFVCARATHQTDSDRGVDNTVIRYHQKNARAAQPAVAVSGMMRNHERKKNCVVKFTCFAMHVLLLCCLFSVQTHVHAPVCFCFVVGKVYGVCTRELSLFGSGRFMHTFFRV